MSITQREALDALAWLADLPHAPAAGFGTPEGRAWLGRLSEALAGVKPTGPELTAACKSLSGKAGQFFPTPMQIAILVVSRRVVAQGSSPRDPTPPPGGIEGLLGCNREVGAGKFVRGTREGFRFRDQVEFHLRGMEIQRRGDAGVSCVDAVLREEREQDECEARGEQWTPQRYGPSVLAGGIPGLQQIAQVRPKTGREKPRHLRWEDGADEHAAKTEDDY
jgi:hypothetical protein